MGIDLTVQDHNGKIKTTMTPNVFEYDRLELQGSEDPDQSKERGERLQVGLESAIKTRPEAWNFGAFHVSGIVSSCADLVSAILLENTTLYTLCITRMNDIKITNILIQAVIRCCLTFESLTFDNCYPAIVFFSLHRISRSPDPYPRFKDICWLNVSSETIIEITRSGDFSQTKFPKLERVCISVQENVTPFQLRIFVTAVTRQFKKATQLHIHDLAPNQALVDGGAELGLSVLFDEPDLVYLDRDYDWDDGSSHKRAAGFNAYDAMLLDRRLKRGRPSDTDGDESTKLGGTRKPRARK